MPLKEAPAFTEVEKLIEGLYERGFGTGEVMYLLSDAPGIEKYLRKFINKYDKENPDVMG